MSWEPIVCALWFVDVVIAAVCVLAVLVYAWFRAVRWLVRRLP